MATNFYSDSYNIIKAKSDRELKSLIRSTRDKADAVSIATRAMCNYELLARAAGATTQNRTKPASLANRRKAQSIVQAFNDKRKGQVLSKMSAQDIARISDLNTYEIR